MKEPKLQRAGSGCFIKGVRYKWRLIIPFTKNSFFVNKSQCKGKVYQRFWSREILFTDKSDAQYYFIKSFSCIQ